MWIRKNAKGSLSIEAAIALPLFTCFILSISLLIRIFNTHGIIQNALNQTANEMAEYSYIYSICTSIEPSFGDVLSKTILQKNLDTEISDANSVLKRMGIENGFSDLDLSQSKILEGSKDIELVVRYKLKITLPIKLIPDLFIIQRSSVRAWLDSENTNETYDYEDDGSNIWELEPMARGRAIQKLYGRNLPAAYPLITKFDETSGEATVVKSIDLTSPTYQKVDNLETIINNLIMRMAEFSGGQYGDFSIEIGDINYKKIVVVVPEGSIKQQMKWVFEQQAKIANNYNVYLEVIEYGVKQDMP